MTWRIKMQIDLSELAIAIDYVACGGEVYVDPELGDIHYISDCGDIEVPDDIDTNDKYIDVPSKQDFDLSRTLVLDFTEKMIPDELERIYDIFRSQGAYSRFKAILHERNLTEKWYDFENKAVEEKLIEWCKENSIQYKKDT